MRKLYRYITLILISTFATFSIYGQDPYNQEEPDGSAYMQGARTAHWSAYVPLTILVGAAIWFGIADRHHSHHHSNNSQDGLGRIASSKRMSRFSAHSRFKPGANHKNPKHHAKVAHSHA